MSRYKELQTCIDLAWSNPTQEEKALQTQLFPEGKPSPFVFIERIGSYVLLSRKYGIQ